MSERVLFVHAHPDDESIDTGGTIATLIDRGATVTVLTCTRGERGEVIPPELQSLEDDREALAGYRTGELARAMEALGVTDQRFLGEADARRDGLSPRRYLDSGMSWGEFGPEPVGEFDPESLCAASVGDIAADIATVIVDIKADTVISYNGYGGYGHPDHIRVHDAALWAAQVLGVPYYAIEPNEQAVGAETKTIDVSAALDRKTAALRAHRTQLTVDGDSFSLSSGAPRPIASAERFQRLRAPSSSDWRDQSLSARIIACLLALLLGIGVGTLGTVNHQLLVTIGTVELWTGLAASLVIAAALLAGLRLVFDSRIVAGVAALGLLAVVSVLSVSGPGGSVLIPANPLGYSWTFGVVIVCLVVFAWPNIRRRGAVEPRWFGARESGARDTIESSSEPKGMPSL